MSRLREHLDSPQYPDEEPLPEDAARQPGLSLVKISSGWVQPGQPRWRAYLFFSISLFGGVALVLTSGPGGIDLIGWVGLAFAAFGIYGLIETVRGKRLPRLQTRPPDD